MKLEDVLEKDILELNENNLQEFREKYRAGKITWVLGAGVSVPVGLPQWGTLLAKIWARLSEMGYEVDGDEIGREPADAASFNAKYERRDKYAFAKAYQENLERIRDVKGYHEKVEKAYGGGYKRILSQTNLLEVAEYVWNYIGDFIEDFQREDRDFQKYLQMQVLKALVRSSLSVDVDREELKVKLSEQVVGVLAQKLAKDKKGTVITYNYDDVLEFCLQEIRGLTDADVRVICDVDGDKESAENKINIHHPHGAVKVVGCDLGKESEAIILTESSYYAMEKHVYIWENSVQAKALVETSCVFIGFSGEDYNFRRIIKHSKPQRREEMPKHYIFLCIDDLVKSVYGEEGEKHCEERGNHGGLKIRNHSGQNKDGLRMDAASEEEFIYEKIQLINMLYMRYNYWKRHGIVPIWSTFEELPTMIKGSACSLRPGTAVLSTVPGHTRD